MKRITLYIKGMHCPSCDVLIKDKLLEIKNIKRVQTDFRNQEADIEYEGELDKKHIDKKISRFGYQLANKEDLQKLKEPFINRLFQVGVITVIVIICYKIIQEAKIIPDTQLTGNVNYLAVFLLGMVASTSTCMATSGALFLATIGNVKRNNTSFIANIFPAILFNLGRVISYGLFGFLAGIIGKALIINFQLGSWLAFFVAVFMIMFGLDMAGIFSIGAIIPSGLSKKIFSKIEEQLLKKPRQTAFFLGAITYLLPCGFTQTVQVYALGLANPIQSMLTMFMFALGTVPALMLIGSLSTLAQSRYYSYFIKTVGVIVLLIGLSYLINSLTLLGINFDSTKIFSPNQKIDTISENGKQIIRMMVDSTGYWPNKLYVKKNIPVKWIIDGKNVFGCQGFFMVPKLNYQRALEAGDNIIEFTPKESGTINFSCGMGMYRGQIIVVE